MDFTEIDALILATIGTRTRWVCSYSKNAYNKCKSNPELNHFLKYALGVKRRYKDEAYYDVDSDTIYLPSKNKFSDIEHYYSTYIHELCHSTAHFKRLGRLMAFEYGSKGYCKEEIISETCALYFTSSHNMHKPQKQSLAYINKFAKMSNLTLEEIHSCLKQAKVAYELLVLQEDLYGKLYKI